jgi:hypothetical protein
MLPKSSPYYIRIKAFLQPTLQSNKPATHWVTAGNDKRSEVSYEVWHTNQSVADNTHERNAGYGRWRDLPIGDAGRVRQVIFG